MVKCVDFPAVGTWLGTSVLARSSSGFLANITQNLKKVFNITEQFNENYLVAGVASLFFEKKPVHPLTEYHFCSLAPVSRS